MEALKQSKSIYGMDHARDTPPHVFSRETFIDLAGGLMFWLFPKPAAAVLRVRLQS